MQLMPNFTAGLARRSAQRARRRLRWDVLDRIAPLRPPRRLDLSWDPAEREAMAGSRVLGGAVHDPRDPRQDGGRMAHGTGLAAAREHGAAKVEGPPRAARVANGGHLRVRRRVAVAQDRAHAVPTTRPCRTTSAPNGCSPRSGFSQASRTASLTSDCASQDRRLTSPDTVLRLRRRAVPDHPSATPGR
jgi:hypothetical protein